MKKQAVATNAALFAELRRRAEGVHAQVRAIMDGGNNGVDSGHLQGKWGRPRVARSRTRTWRSSRKMLPSFPPRSLLVCVEVVVGAP